MFSNAILKYLYMLLIISIKYRFARFLKQVTTSTNLTTSEFLRIEIIL
jgi:hypothetical protein